MHPKPGKNAAVILCAMAALLIFALADCEPVSSASTLPPNSVNVPPSLNMHAIIPDLSPDFETPADAPDLPNVMIYSIERLVKIHALLGCPPLPDEIPLSELTSHFAGWKPIYLPKSDCSLDDQILFSAAIIDGAFIAKVRDAILATGFDPAKVDPGDGHVALFKDFIPANYPSDNLVINRRANQIVLYPVLDLEADLNVPAFRWRIYQMVDGQRNLIADWPVVVGRPSKRTQIVPQIMMDQMEHYPSWTDPETGRYVGPGPRNPLGIWKLKSSFNRRRWYYHGTNQPKLLGRDWRAFSHGCIRNDNDNIRRLGWLLVSHNAGSELRPGLVTGRLDVIPEKRTRVVPLVHAVQARNYYDTVEVLRRDPLEDSLLVFYPNIYWVSGENEVYHLTTLDHLRQTLLDLGIPPDQFDEQRAQILLAKMKRIRVTAEAPVKQVLVGSNDQIEPPEPPPPDPPPHRHRRHHRHHH